MEGSYDWQELAGDLCFTNPFSHFSHYCSLWSSHALSRPLPGVGEDSSRLATGGWQDGLKFLVNRGILATTGSGGILSRRTDIESDIPLDRTNDD